MFLKIDYNVSRFNVLKVVHDLHSFLLSVEDLRKKRVILDIPRFFQSFSSLHFFYGVRWFLFDDGLHDDVFWIATTSKTTFLASNRESHAFLFLRLPNRILGSKVRIGLGDWLYYVQFFTSMVAAGLFYSHKQWHFLGYCHIYKRFCVSNQFREI